MILMNHASLINERGLPASGPLAGHGWSGYRARHAVMNSSCSPLTGISCSGTYGIMAAAGASHRGRWQQSLSGVWGREPPSVNRALGNPANPVTRILMGIVSGKTGILSD